MLHIAIEGGLKLANRDAIQNFLHMAMSDYEEVMGLSHLHCSETQRKFW